MKADVCLGAKFIYCRTNAELSVAQMASLLNIKKDEYFKYECRQVEPPLRILLKFTRCFDVPMEDFADEDIDIVDFEIKYDQFHFAKFREKHKFFERMIMEKISSQVMRAEHFYRKPYLKSENE